eukprot:TRINITY_DN6609_c0_g1_i1.p1 TRINITY_DN6609_c0_g1~~TRINITY_DN6609_c0_g1_i1.p1  ORF type:complete len:215 (-),score=35.85 TRINITY_DN6609_c0_g1_i1:41-685(-)
MSVAESNTDTQVAGTDETEDGKRRRTAEQNMSRLKAEFTELKNQLFEQKLREVKMELAAATAGAHKAILAENEQLMQWKEEKLRMAKLQHELEEENLRKIHFSEQKQIDDDFENDKYTYKNRLMTYLSSRQRFLEEEQKAFMIEDDDEAARKRRKKNIVEPQQPASVGKRKQPPPQISYSLKEADILEDLFTIQKACFPTGTRSGYGGGRRGGN